MSIPTIEGVTAQMIVTSRLIVLLAKVAWES